MLISALASWSNFPTQAGAGRKTEDFALRLYELIRYIGFTGFSVEGLAFLASPGGQGVVDLKGVRGSAFWF